MDNFSYQELCSTCGRLFPSTALFCPYDGSPLDIADVESKRFVDPYLGYVLPSSIEIHELIGVGSLARVYRAIRQETKQELAVKILDRSLSSNAECAMRFQREAKIASQLHHPHIVRVYEAGKLADGVLYLVMEYLDGCTLAKALEVSGGRMPLPRTLRIGLQMCEAMGTAHEQGIVHRDLKPENVMLVEREGMQDFVKLLDFGMARLSQGDSLLATAAGVVFGTARYISPEAAQGDSVGPASDVYSIAMLLYQMIAGCTPFEATQGVSLLLHQIQTPPTPLRSLEGASYVPLALEQAILRNLAKEPQARDPDAKVFGQALILAMQASGLSVEEVLSDQIPRDTKSRATPETPSAQMQAPSVSELDTTWFSNGETSANTASVPPRHPIKYPVWLLVLFCFFLGAAGASWLTVKLLGL